MSDITKRIIAAVFAAVALAVFIYGTYLPYRKSSLYVAAITAGNAATSLQDFLIPYMKSLDAVSPVGQDELSRNFASTAGNIVDKVGKKDPVVVSALGAVIDQYALPVIERRSGISAAQTMYVIGTTYRKLFTATGEEQYKNRTEKVYEYGLELSPDRPQLLYSQFFYQLNFGTREEALELGEHILRLWPSDRTIEKDVNALKK